MGALILNYNFKEYLYPLVLWSPQQTNHAIPFLRQNQNQRKKKKKKSNQMNIFSCNNFS